MVLLKSVVIFEDLKLHSTFYEINKSNLNIFGNSSLFSQDFEDGGILHSFPCCLVLIFKHKHLATTSLYFGLQST